MTTQQATSTWPMQASGTQQHARRTANRKNSGSRGHSCASGSMAHIQTHSATSEQRVGGRAAATASWRGSEPCRSPALLSRGRLVLVQHLRPRLHHKGAAIGGPHALNVLCGTGGTRGGRGRQGSKRTWTGVHFPGQDGPPAAAGGAGNRQAAGRAQHSTARAASHLRHAAKRGLHRRPQLHQLSQHTLPQAAIPQQRLAGVRHRPVLQRCAGQAGRAGGRRGAGEGQRRRHRA